MKLADAPAILQVMAHNRLGGVKILASMVGEGLGRRGYTVDTVFLSSGIGIVSTILNLLDIFIRIKSRRYPIIFAYSSASSLYSTLIGFLFRTPTRVVHQTAALEGVRPLWRRLDKIFGTIGIYTHIVSNSNATTADYAAWPRQYRRRLSLILHGVSELPDSPDKCCWRQTLGIPREAFVIVTSGRLDDQKNHDLVVRSLAQLPAVHFVVVGEGENRMRLIALATATNVSDRLHLIGALPRSKLREVLNAGNVFAFPSVWETFGLAAVEAAMVGLPIIASDLCVLHEVLDLLPDLPDERKLVAFHPTRDVEAFAACVRYRQQNPALEEDIKKFSDLHRQRYGFDRMINDYEKLLQELGYPL